MRRRADQPADPTGQELTQFFTALQDESKLREYHADPEAYVQAQQEQGVVSAGASQLILSGNLQDVQASMARAAGGAAPVCIVMPPS
jgi:hypothetical protein